MELSELGYDAAQKFNEQRSGAVARVVAEHRELYRVLNASGEREARITGALRAGAKGREAFPAVGDWVAITELDAEKAMIHAVLPRRTVLRRKEAGGSDAQLIASNVDTAFIVQAVGRDFNINRVERTCALALAGGVQPVVILNKTDMATRQELEALTAALKSRLPDADVILANTAATSGLETVRGRLEPRRTYCFIGSSGVGKSTIINRLLGSAVLETGAISTRTKKGMHVTTMRQLFVLDNGAMVIDNPGMRELGVMGSDAGIDETFGDITELAGGCKFTDCTHAREPGCAVRTAIEVGTVDASRFANYDKLKRENAFHDMTDLQRRQKDKAFGKFVNKVVKQISREHE